MDFEHKSTTAIDPVCGMTVNSASAQAKVDQAGKTYYFCCAGCARKFESAPGQYLKPKPAGLVTLGAPGQRSAMAPTDLVVIGPTQPKTGELARDPVCGMSVNPATAKYEADYAGKTYYL